LPSAKKKKNALQIKGKKQPEKQEISNVWPNNESIVGFNHDKV
jgi:hypothetical protein